MPKPNRHISSIRESHPEAYAAYVELLVEDCTDKFEVNDDGVFATYAHPDGFEPGPKMKWDAETKSWEQQD
jgi:hypothetical protein